MGARTALTVDGEEGALQLPRPFRLLIAPRRVAQKLPDGLLRRDAQHALPGAGHAQVGDVAGALGQDAGIGGLHMGVGAQTAETRPSRK